MTWNLIGQAAVICLLISITALFNARILWLVKYKKDDPLKALKPFWEVNQEDSDINNAFINKSTFYLYSI